MLIVNVAFCRQLFDRKYFTTVQLALFEKRYDNGYDIYYVDKDYVRWLSLYHPDALPDDLSYDSTPPTPSDNFGSDIVLHQQTAPLIQTVSHHQVKSSDEGSKLDTDFFSDDQIATFQERYENGYEFLLDKDYTRWLTVHHTDALLQRTNSI